MRVIRYVEDIGSYFNMLKQTFSGFTKGSVLRELIFKEINDLILDSLCIVSFISFCVGGVVAIHTALNMDHLFLHKTLLSFATHQSITLDISPTCVSLIMLHKTR